MEGEHETYAERLAKRAESVLNDPHQMDAGFVLIADALLVHSAAVDRLASAVLAVKQGRPDPEAGGRENL
jgi:hypothetical protein